MTATAELPDVMETFTASLAADAGRAEQPAAASAPPRKSDNPDAPHGFEDDGVTPKAPYGHKPDGRPRIKPGGPGRARPAGEARNDDKARVVDVRPGASASASSPGSAEDGADYTEALTDLGQTVWMAGSMLKGGRLFFLPLPDTRPYAMVWRHEMPSLVAAGNVACRQSPAVRSYLQRMSGEGSWSWRIGVAVAGVGLVTAIAEMAKAPPAIKAAAAAANDAALEEFVTGQLAELGLAPAGVEHVGQAPAAVSGVAA